MVVFKNPNKHISIGTLDRGQQACRNIEVAVEFVKREPPLGLDVNLLFHRWHALLHNGVTKHRDAGLEITTPPAHAFPQVIGVLDDMYYPAMGIEYFSVDDSFWYH